MLEYDFQRSLAFWVGSAARGIERALNDELAPHGITLRQVQVLACLALKKEISQTELADLIGVETSTLVRTLDRMERDGWVERHPAPGDRRKKLIRATNKVKPKWQTIVECGERVEENALQGAKKAELEVTKRVLARLVEATGGGS